MSFRRRNMPALVHPRPPVQQWYGAAAAVLMCLYVYCGRWGSNRFDEVDERSYGASPASQLRIYVVLLTILLVLLTPRWRPPHHVSKEMTKANVLTGCFYLYVLVSVLWAPIEEVPLMKAGDVLIALCALLCFSHLIRHSIVAELTTWLCTGLAAAGLALAGIAIMTGYHESPGRVAALGGGANMFGRNLALCAIAGVFLIAVGRRLWLGWLAVVIGPLFVLQSGSRGALGALIMAVPLAALCIGRHAITSRRVAVAFVTVSIASFAGWYTGAFDRARTTYESRIVDLTLQRGYFSFRPELSMAALNLGMEHPFFGAGLGAFAARRPFGQEYPHNVILETFGETGACGVLLLLSVLTMTGMRIVRAGGREAYSLGALWIVCFGSSLFSGDLYDSRGMFLLVPLIYRVCADRSAKLRLMRPLHAPAA